MGRNTAGFTAIILLAVTAPAQMRQNPSPMIDTTRPHDRAEERKVDGKRFELSTGTLFIPANLRLRPASSLWIHFHGASWLAESAAAQIRRYPVLTVQLGAGSDVYAAPFKDHAAIGRLIAEAEQKAGVRFPTLILSSWSAGYGAVREFLRDPETYKQTRAFIALDSIHAGYDTIDKDLDAFVEFSGDATRGAKRLLITHSEVFPGTFASTTETADFLLKHLRMRRSAVLRNGPNGMQMISDTRRRGLMVMGFAGNSAPDHEDHMYALYEFMRMGLRRVP